MRTAAALPCRSAVLRGKAKLASVLNKSSNPGNLVVIIRSVRRRWLALASFGVYWYPLSPGTIAQDQQDGVLMDAHSYCHLSATGGVNLSLYADTQAAESSPDQLAKTLRVGEAKGWTPHVSTQGWSRRVPSGLASVAGPSRRPPRLRCLDGTGHRPLGVLSQLDPGSRLTGRWGIAATAPSRARDPDHTAGGRSRCAAML